MEQLEALLPAPLRAALATAAARLPAWDTFVSLSLAALAAAASIAVLALAYLNYNAACPLVLHGVSNDVTVVSGRRRRSGTADGDETDARHVSVWSLREYLSVACPSFSVPFTPTFFLALGHLQTWYASLGTIDGRAEYYRELLDTPDGGQIAVDWSKPPRGAPAYREDTTTVVVLHGLTGGSHESYVQDLVHYLMSPTRGYRCVVVNFRGCADSELRTPQLYNGAYTDDFRFALRHVRGVIPRAKLGAIGFSLGSNVLVKYLGEEGENAPFAAAASVCNPFDFLLSAEEILSTPISRVYSKALAENLKKAYARHAHVISTHPQIRHDRVMAAKHVWEFDDRVTRVLFGYHTVEDYYRAASSCNYVDRVRVPLFCLNALDDPISPLRAIPFAAADRNPFVMIGTTRLGGHIGHFTGVKPKRWSTEVYGQWLTAMLEAESITVRGFEHHGVGKKVPASPQRDSGVADLSDADADEVDDGTTVAGSASPVTDDDEAVVPAAAAPVAAPKKTESTRGRPRTQRPVAPPAATAAVPRAVPKPDTKEDAVARFYGARAWMLPLLRWLVRNATGSRALAAVLVLLGLRRLAASRR
ncbi:hypothetical protein H9P43_005565 [Blastocladiella emersonii ATCC 22665]|nr:hypothetical protein H9P43_005565 [Blastocladiella emersonii ATCC 22665]